MSREYINAIYILLTIIFLILFLTCLNKAITFWQAVEEVQRTDSEASYRVQEYSKYSNYDNTECSGADLVAAILRYNDPSNNFEVKVYNKSGVIVNYDATSTATLETTISIKSVYIATLQWSDDSSYIIGIHFTEI